MTNWLSVRATVEMAIDVILRGALVSALITIVMILTLESIREAKRGSVLVSG